jgi:ribosome-associated translation inhibitor RaiA
VNDVQIDFVGRGIDLNDEIRAYAEDKLAGTVRFLHLIPELGHIMTNVKSA